MLDVWLSIDADSDEEARRRVERISHEAELEIDELYAVGEILEIEEDIIEADIEDEEDIEDDGLL